MKQKIWKYHTQHSYTTKNGQEFNFNSQLYMVGIYGIINNDPAMQVSFTPTQMVSLEKRLKKAFEKNEILNLQFSNLISVTKDKFGYVKIEQNETL